MEQTKRKKTYDGWTDAEYFFTCTQTNPENMNQRKQINNEPLDVRFKGQ